MTEDVKVNQIMCEELGLYDDRKTHLEAERIFAKFITKKREEARRK